MSRKSILIVLRCAGERTAIIAHLLAEAQTDVVAINERPFFNAVIKTFEIGALNSQYQWLLALDADVLLNRCAIQTICSLITGFDDKVLKIDMRIADKFRGTVYAGCHIYNNMYSAEIVSNMTDPSFVHGIKRPESSSISLIGKKLGLKSVCLKNDPVGRHDFEQFYKHIYAKYYNRAIRDCKSINKIRMSICNKISNNPCDMDFAMALRGLNTGDGRPETDIKLDWASYPDATMAMAELRLSEKEIIDVSKIYSKNTGWFSGQFDAYWAGS